jgi:solute carrier family 35 protein E1
MLACSFDLTISNILGLVCAFGSTLVFVSQNIFFKKIMPTNSDTAGGAKLDKINLLYFSSSTAFVLMIPVWLYSDAARLWVSFSAPRTANHVTLYFFLNGTVHFAQNLLAFAILSSTSPVTYSIASLVKRIAVICLAIVWFKQPVHGVQAVGIALTGVGLLMYNNAKRDVEKGEKKMRQVEAVRDGILPLNKTDQRVLDGLGIKEAHASPKPDYVDEFAPLHSSKTTAVYYNQPTHPYPPNPYPSPPPSTSSSPPPPRHRRMSVEARDEHFRFPPSNVLRPVPIQEESNIVTAGAS